MVDSNVVAKLTITYKDKKTGEIICADSEIVDAIGGLLDRLTNEKDLSVDDVEIISNSLEIS